MELFDKRFVYFMWDASLKDKECFLADNIQSLKDFVNSNASAVRVWNEGSNPEYPFVAGVTAWRFAYYDPNYACKVAYAEGKQIQMFNKNQWIDCVEPLWLAHKEYRVAQPGRRRMTNKELAEWLAQGNGQKREGQNKFVYTTYAYKGHDNTPCRVGVLIRGWAETKWHEPEIMEGGDY